MDEELKPCPFCGGELKVSEDKGRDYDTPRYYITCIDCGVTSTSSMFKDELINKWNQRAEPENKPLTWDELKKLEGEYVYVIETFSNNKDDNIEDWVLIKNITSRMLVSEEINSYAYTKESFGTGDGNWLAYKRKPE